MRHINVKLGKALRVLFRAQLVFQLATLVIFTEKNLPMYYCITNLVYVTRSKLTFQKRLLKSSRLADITSKPSNLGSEIAQ